MDQIKISDIPAEIDRIPLFKAHSFRAGPDRTARHQRRAQVTFVEPLIGNGPLVAQLAGRRDEGMRIIDSDHLVTKGGKFKTRPADGASQIQRPGPRASRDVFHYGPHRKLQSLPLARGRSSRWQNFLVGGVVKKEVFVEEFG
jgi:hypothetical protein